MRRIKVGLKWAVVDDCDAAQCEYRWSLHSSGYAMRHSGGRTLLLHREVLGLRPGDQNVDHVNGKKLDCRRSNLRLCDQRQNLANSRKRAGCTSKYKGVCAWAGKWRAYICEGGRDRHLGMFLSEIDAAKAYDEAALREWGDFARTNFGKGKA